MDFKEWLKEEMRVREWNPSQLAGVSKVPQPTIFRILSGETKDPRQNTVKKLERALGSTSPPLAIEAPPHHDLIEAWEYLLPGQQREMLDRIKAYAQQNQEAAAQFRPKVVRVVDHRKRQVAFDGPDRRSTEKDNHER
jgi:hypothetical protein